MIFRFVILVQKDNLKTIVNYWQRIAQLVLGPMGLEEVELHGISDCWLKKMCVVISLRNRNFGFGKNVKFCRNSVILKLFVFSPFTYSTI